VAGIAGRLLSTTASAVAKQLWSLKSAATKTGNNRRPVASSFPSPILGLFFTRSFLTPAPAPVSGGVDDSDGGRGGAAQGAVRGRVRGGHGVRRQQAGDRAARRRDHPRRRPPRARLHQQQHLQGPAAAVTM